ncbi:MAG: toprim domain-containing protein, partial [Vicinamibacteria bacterium]
AGGSAKQGRDRRFQAILPMFGKMLNVEKARLDRVLSSDKIRPLVIALGAGIGETFDIDKLRYHRVIIMTDADVDGSHIRTLLLTFFYRQMRELIDNGHVFIAQPPLYRAKRGKQEVYIKDDRELETWLIRRATESRILKLVDRDRELSGEALEAMLHKLIAFDRNLRHVERRGLPPDVVRALLDAGARDRQYFADRTPLESLASSLSTEMRQVRTRVDEEHDGFLLEIDDRSAGYPRVSVVGATFVESPEYRTLLASYRDVADIGGRMVIAHAAKAQEEVEETQLEVDLVPTDTAAPAPTGEGEGGTARRSRRDEDHHVSSVSELVAYFLEAGRKGVAINRYKGLGEMNPDTLWETTMKPEVRTLLQVRAEDHAVADLMFSTLMGDQVEPRRQFIEDNALDVKNLDI